jgi:hypothetical protein
VHGVFVLAYHRFLVDRFGREAADGVLGEGRKISLRASYDDALFLEWVHKGAALGKRSVERHMREFGAHAITTLHELYPVYFPPEGARRFLLSLEHNVHARVRSSIDGAAPPTLAVTDLGHGRIRIGYRSPRHLCALLAGLIDGTGTHYQTPIRHTQESCMKRGDPECAFVVEVQQTLLPRATAKK